MSGDAQTLIHATTVAWQGRGALIIGNSGSGKSALALHMMALGCDLIADDQTLLERSMNQITARCPTVIQGQIEARGFGILKTPFVQSAVLVCVIDLNEIETQRLPERRTLTMCGTDLPMFHKCGIDVLPFALLQYLKGSSVKDV